MKASSPRRRTWAEAARIDGEARGESRQLRRRSLRAANESGGEEIATLGVGFCGSCAGVPGHRGRNRGGRSGSGGARLRLPERGRRLDEGYGGDGWASAVSERVRRERGGGLAFVAVMLGLGPRGRRGAGAGYEGETGPGRPK